MFDAEVITVEKKFSINRKWVYFTHKADYAEFIIDVEGDIVFHESIVTPDYNQDERMVEALSLACDIEPEYKLQVYNFLVRCLT